jgi:hypothetical protein
MNKERIKELELEAAYGVIDPNGSFTPEEFNNFTVKFAELIVQECVGILMTPEYPMNHPEELADYNRGWVNGRLLGIEHIREHFEVES